jgi:hypothetical protein
MRAALVLAMSLIGCGARTELETPKGTDEDGEPSCGNGRVEAAEECDAGDDNEDRLALSWRQGPRSGPLAPVWIETDLVSFYSYTSYSAHTGFESLGASRLFFTLDRGSDLALVTLHGIDLESSGQQQPRGRVGQVFRGLPKGWQVVFFDDYTEEFGKTGPAEATGKWRFELNTDGGIVGGLPFPGEWEILVRSDFQEGIDRWDLIDGGEHVPLETQRRVHLVAHADPGPCRTDCTVPRCGDGIVDGGEVCDDGGGGTCGADCSRRR